MARSKFSKMLEKINNNEEVINSKEVEENNKTINSNVNIENEDDDIDEEEMMAYLKECGSEFLDNDEDDEDIGDTEDNFNKDEDDDIDEEEMETYLEECGSEFLGDDNDDNDSTLNDTELNDDADVDFSEDNKKEDSKEENKEENKEDDKKDDKEESKAEAKPEKKVKKNSVLFDMLSRSEGATLDELEKELGWKRASIRGVMSNMQKELEFCLLTIDVSKPAFNKDDGSKAFKKETRYFIRDCEFDLNDTLISLFKIDDMFSKKDNNKDDNKDDNNL